MQRDLFLGMSVAVSETKSDIFPFLFYITKSHVEYIKYRVPKKSIPFVISEH